MSVKHVNMIKVLVYIIYFHVGREVYWELVQVELEVGREALFHLNETLCKCSCKFEAIAFYICLHICGVVIWKDVCLGYLLVKKYLGENKDLKMH